MKAKQFKCSRVVVLPKGLRNSSGGYFITFIHVIPKETKVTAFYSDQTTN